MKHTGNNGAGAMERLANMSPFHLSDCELCMQADPLYIGIFVSSMLFPALASIIKEKIFADAKEVLDGKPLDIFVVNSFGSGAQAIGVLLLLPVLTSLRGLSLSELPQYVGDGKHFSLNFISICSLCHICAQLL